MGTLIRCFKDKSIPCASVEKIENLAELDISLNNRLVQVVHFTDFFLLLGSSHGP